MSFGLMLFPRLIHDVVCTSALLFLDDEQSCVNNNSAYSQTLRPHVLWGHYE